MSKKFIRNVSKSPSSRKIIESKLEELLPEELIKLSNGPQKNCREIFPSEHQKALQGDRASMGFMGAVYDTGIGAVAKSVYWLKKGSDLGDPAAKFFLGVDYLSGYGLETNRQLGAMLVLGAAEAGDKRAIAYCRDTFQMTDEQMRECGISM